MQHITNKMRGLWSEAIEPKANRRLLPPAPSPRGWGNVRDNYRTILEDFEAIYLFGLQFFLVSTGKNGYFRRK